MLKLFQKKHNQKGFTLIELLVVISIIGILSSIVLVSMGGARSKARDAKRQSDIRQTGTALELWYTDIEAYGGALGSATMPTAISTYMAAVPTEQKSGHAAYGWLTNVGSTSEFCIWATLEKTCPTGEVAYYTASHRGVSGIACRSTGAPATLTTCK